MWEHADKPEPKTAFTYSDIDEDDTDLQKAAQWCVENEYLHVRDNDNDRFHPNGWVPKLKVIQAWDKAFGLQAKANADNTGIMDQHCMLRLAPGSDVQVGDILLFGTSHPCLTFDKWKTLLLVDDDYNVLDELDTLF